MTDWAQIFLESSVDDVAVASAVARAFALSGDQVRVAAGPSDQSLAAWRDASVRVVIVRNSVFDLTAERFPILLEIQTRDGVAITREAMQTLGVPFVTNVGGDAAGYRWSLVLPSGDIRTVRVDDDDAFLLSPSDLAAIAGARPIDRRAA